MTSLIKRKCRPLKYRMDMLFHPLKTKWSCPCCGMKFRSFVSGNFMNYPELIDIARFEKTRQDVICPYCRSMPRHRILASWFGEHKKWLQKSDILYFAQEDCIMLWMKRNKVSCTSADLFEKADLKLDIQDTGLPDGSFNVIICNHVLEHVDDFRAALKELYRILKPGGSLICSFPMDPKTDLVDEDPDVRTPEECIKRFGQCDHKRLFGMNADRLLAEAGFQVERVSGEMYPENILPITAPADYDMNCLFHCIKH